MSHGVDKCTIEKRRAPARAICLVFLASVGACFAYVALMVFVHRPLGALATRIAERAGLSPVSAGSVQGLVSLGFTIVEFALAVWLIYRAMLPRVWPEVKQRQENADSEWSKEDVIIALLVIVIVLLITRGV